MALLIMIITLVYLIAWFIQSIFLLNSDVSWLMHAASALSQGGSYTQNFLETNPPLILYLYWPCLYIAHHFHLAIYTALHIYVFLLASFSLWLCARFIKADTFTRSLFLVSVSIVFLIAPLSDFGQREHLTFILIMPYLLLTAERIENKTSYFYLALITGLMAGLGFGLKPFFLGIYALIELYFCYRKRSLIAYFRAETCVLWVVLLLYLSAIFIFHRDYLQVILPLIAPFYYSLYTIPLREMLVLPGSIFAYFTVVFYFICRPNHPQQTLKTLLLIAGFGFWICFVLQRTPWYYHELPSLSFNVLLLTLLFNSLHEKALAQRHYYSLMALTAIMGTYIYFHEAFIYVNLPFKFYLTAYFCMLWGIFSLVLVTSRPIKYLQAACVAALIVAIGAGFYHYLSFTLWYDHKACLTLLLCFLLFAYALPHRTVRSLEKGLFIAIVGLIIYAYPIYRLSYITAYSDYYHQLYQQLIVETAGYKNKSTYFFTNTSETSFPLSDYNHQLYASRFWSFVWLPMMDNPRDIKSYSNFYLQHQASLDFYIDWVLADFKKNNPEIIFVDDRISSHQSFYGAVAPDYLALFSKNKAFNAVWKNYRYIGTLDIHPLCRFKVYQRYAHSGVNALG